jgi:HEPN domain-containing protein
MGNRYLDWLRQADADVQHARNALKAGDFEWSCFAGQQGAEKALKAVFLKLGMEAWGHTLTALIGNLPKEMRVPLALINAAKTLDKHYIPTRYPNGFDSGAPRDFYTKEDAERAIQCAEEILEFCRRQVG